jgi:hypothetical protein
MVSCWHKIAESRQSAIGQNWLWRSTGLRLLQPVPAFAVVLDGGHALKKNAPRRKDGRGAQNGAPAGGTMRAVFSVHAYLGRRMGRRKTACKRGYRFSAPRPCGAAPTPGDPASPLRRRASVRSPRLQGRGGASYGASAGDRGRPTAVRTSRASLPAVAPGFRVPNIRPALP